MPEKAPSTAEVKINPDAHRRARGPSWGCAENCLKEILLRLGIVTGVGELAGLVKATTEGASFADLVRVIKTKGLTAVPKKLSADELESVLLAGEGPAIVHMSYGGGHFSIAEAFEGRIRLLDPPDRVWESGPARLREAFTGFAMFFKGAGRSRSAVSPTTAQKPTRR